MNMRTYQYATKFQNIFTKVMPEIMTRAVKDYFNENISFSCLDYDYSESLNSIMICADYEADGSAEEFGANLSFHDDYVDVWFIGEQHPRFNVQMKDYSIHKNEFMQLEEHELIEALSRIFSAKQIWDSFNRFILQKSMLSIKLREHNPSQLCRAYRSTRRSGTPSSLNMIVKNDSIRLSWVAASKQAVYTESSDDMMIFLPSLKKSTSGKNMYEIDGDADHLISLSNARTAGKTFAQFKLNGVNMYIEYMLADQLCRDNPNLIEKYQFDIQSDE